MLSAAECITYNLCDKCPLTVAQSSENNRLSTSTGQLGVVQQSSVIGPNHSERPWPAQMDRLDCWLGQKVGRKCNVARKSRSHLGQCFLPHCPAVREGCQANLSEPAALNASFIKLLPPSANSSAAFGGSPHHPVPQPPTWRSAEQTGHKQPWQLPPAKSSAIIGP